jgi:peptidoglycan hydrolase-like protein with peptidoglycan-binding domain
MIVSMSEKPDPKFPLAAKLLRSIGGPPAAPPGAPPQGRINIDVSAVARPAEPAPKAAPSPFPEKRSETKRLTKGAPPPPPARPTGALIGGIDAAPEAKAVLERLAAMVSVEAKTYARDPDGYDLLEGARHQAPVGRGSSSSIVFALQRALNLAGVHVEANGLYDPAMELAVRNFQRRHNVEVTGAFGPDSMAALDRALKVRPRGKPARVDDTPPGEIPRTENAFVDSIAEAAVKAMHESTFPASLHVAMAVLLSGFGERPVARDQRNLFGLEGTGPAGEVVLKESGVQRTFRVYHDHAEAIREHARFLVEESEPHRCALANQAGPDAMARALEDLYPRVPHFGETAIRIMRQFDLYRLDRVRKE